MSQAAHAQERKSGKLASLPYIAIIGVCLICILHLRLLLIDDGFIAHRYAANLVRGHGLVFTAGQRVEGFSDLSWILLMTIPQLLGWRPELFALTVGVLCGIAAFVVAYRTATSYFRIPATLAAALVCLAACNADYWITAANGIESGLYSLVVVGAFALLLHRRMLWAGVVLGFATTLRPESMALAPIAFLCVAFHDASPRSALLSGLWKSFWRNRLLLVPWAVIVLGVLVWRFAYYGELIPNTVVAKSHPLHLGDLYFGTKYLFLFFLEAAPWVILPLCAGLTKRDLAWYLGMAWLAYQVVVIMLNGGDWMFGFRFMSVFFPLLVLLSAQGLWLLSGRLKTSRNLLYAGVALLALAGQITNKSWTLTRGVLYHHDLLEIIPAMYEPYYLNIAKVLKPALLPSDVIAPEVLGVVSYVLIDNPMHDWLGLVDSYVAHHGTVYFPTFGKADPQYSVDSVAPAVFAFASGPTTVEIFQSKTHGGFAQKYGCWEVIGQPIILAFRRDREPALLEALRTAKLPIRPFFVKGSS